MDKFKEFYFGDRSKFDRYSIIESVRNSNSFNRSGDETTSNAKALLLWEAKYQNSWIVRTNARVYKILDDVRKERPIINWSRSITLFKGEDLFSTIDYKKNTGKIIFKHKPNKEYRYSKRLFYNYEKSMKDIINSFVKIGKF